MVNDRRMAVFIEDFQRPRLLRNDIRQLGRIISFIRCNFYTHTQALRYQFTSLKSEKEITKLTCLGKLSVYEPKRIYTILLSR